MIYAFYECYMSYNISHDVLFYNVFSWKSFRGSQKPSAIHLRQDCGVVLITVYSCTGILILDVFKRSSNWRDFPSPQKAKKTKAT